MEEKKETTVTEPVVNKDEKSGETKTFTQEELNNIVEERIAKIKKSIPTKEELDELKLYKESKKTDEQKRIEEQTRLATVEKEKSDYQQRFEILTKGVSAEDVEYIQFKVSKMDGDFNDNLTKFLVDNPKYTTKEPAKKADTTGFRQSTTPTKNEQEAYLDDKYKNNPWYKGK